MHETKLRMARNKVKDLTFLVDDPELSAKKRAQLDQELARTEELASQLDAMGKEQRKYEQVLWSKLWKTPMAVEWDKLMYTHEVALYVRWQIRAELGDVKAASESRLRADTLGLTPMSLLRLRWGIEDSELPAATAPRSGGRARYGHLRPVQDGAS